MGCVELPGTQKWLNSGPASRLPEQSRGASTLEGPSKIPLDSSRFLSTMRLHQDAAKLLIHECCDVHVQAGLDSMLVQNHGMCSLHVLGAAFHTSNFFLDNQMHQLLHAPFFQRDQCHPVSVRQLELCSIALDAFGVYSTCTRRLAHS